MKHLAVMLSLIAPAALAADIAHAPESVSLTVHYVDVERRPIDAAYLPPRIRFNIRPIPGGVHGVPLGVNLLDVEADVGDAVELDLVALGEQAAPISLQMQKTGAYSTAEVEPEDVKVLRLGTFAASAAGAQFNSSTGIAADVDQPLTLVLVWFDQAASITGSGVSGGTTFEFDISAPGPGFRWVQYEEFEPDSYRVTDRNTEAEPYLTIEVKQIEWVVLEKRDDGYSLMGRQLEGADHLISLLRDAGAFALMLDDDEEWSISDISHLGPMLDGSEFPILYRDAEGTVRRVGQGQTQ